MKKCFFFDRDGIVNRSPGEGYVERWEDFEIEPVFPIVMRKVVDAGYDVVIVTNQRGIALGRLSIKELEKIHTGLKLTLNERYNLDLLDIFYCPHGNNECDCRKPLPGLFLNAAKKHGISMPDSWTVGDSPRDVEAGRRAGCGRTVLVSGSETSTFADMLVEDMDHLAQLLDDKFKAPA